MIRPLDFKIYHLKENGMTFSAIAKELGISIAKVELSRSRMSRWMNPINDFSRDISVRLLNCLREIGYPLRSKQDLKNISKINLEKLTRSRNFGKKSLTELNNLLLDHGFKKITMPICKECKRPLQTKIGLGIYY